MAPARSGIDHSSTGTEAPSPEDDTFVVCAPFGFQDLFAMVVRPNKAIIDREVYEMKASRWAEQWPRLTVLPW